MLEPLPEGELAGHMAQKTLAEGVQLLDLVGGHLAAFQLVTEGIEAVGGFARVSQEANGNGVGVIGPPLV